MVVLLIMLQALFLMAPGSGYSPLFSFSFFSFAEDDKQTLSTFGFLHFISMPASAAVKRKINLLRY